MTHKKIGQYWCEGGSHSYPHQLNHKKTVERKVRLGCGYVKKIFKLLMHCFKEKKQKPHYVDEADQPAIFLVRFAQENTPSVNNDIISCYKIAFIFIIHQIFLLARDWCECITRLNMLQLKLGNVRVMFLDF